MSHMYAFVNKRTCMYKQIPYRLMGFQSDGNCLFIYLKQIEDKAVNVRFFMKYLDFILHVDAFPSVAGSQ